MAAPASPSGAAAGSTAATLAGAGGAAAGTAPAMVSRVRASMEALRSSGATGAAAPRPSANAKAPAMISATGAEIGRPVSNCSTSGASAATALRSSAIMAGVRDRVLSMRRFRRFSIDQPNSAISRAPTIRPLPFSVWKLRRRTPSDSRSMGFWSHSGKLVWMDAISSLASSMKSSRNCGSTSGCGSTGRSGCSGACAPGGGPIATVACAASSRARSGLNCTVLAAASPAAGRSSSGTREGASSARALMHISALSSMYHGSLRPFCSVSM